MRQRVISALVGLVILAAALALINTLAFNALIAAISTIGLYEMLRATGCLKSKALAALSFSMPLIMPFSQELLITKWVAQIIFIFFLLFFFLLIKNSTTISVEQTAMAFMFSIFIPLFFSCAVFMRNKYGAYVGGFYVLMALGAAWLSDSGAYFAGRKFGKRKLAPIISPNKTFEGAIGGVISCTVFMLLIAAGFEAAVTAMGKHVAVNYPLLILVMPVFSVLGVLGDLSASVIKRQFNVKDYGKIMPGHGGIMDRFDSVLFTMPSVFIISSCVNIIVVN